MICRHEVNSLECPACVRRPALDGDARRSILAAARHEVLRSIIARLKERDAEHARAMEGAGVWEMHDRIVARKELAAVIRELEAGL